MAYLNKFGETIQEQISPAGLAVHRKERSPDACIKGDEPFIACPQTIFDHDLAYRAQIKTCVFTLDDTNVGDTWDQSSCIGRTIENKYKVGMSM